MEWERVPFYGGCDYHGPIATVTGEYAPGLTELACTEWRASNLPGHVFESATAAMDAAEAAGRAVPTE